jgi:hypothetical protein
LFFAVRDPDGTFDKLFAMLVGLLLEDTILIIPVALLKFFFSPKLLFP